MIYRLLVNVGHIGFRQVRKRHVRFLPGPVFANIILADEINRTPPKTQAALLEAMQEKRVTIAGQPFSVVGVAAPGFTGLLRGLGQEAWVPFGASDAVNPGNDFFTERQNRSLLLFGHLAPGATLPQVEAQANAAARALRQAEPAAWTTL